MQWGEKIRTDSVGQNGIGMALRETSDHGFLIGGSAANADLLIVRLDSAGAILWIKQHGFGIAVGAVSLDTDRDQGFILSINASLPAGGYVVALDSMGSVRWSKKYGSPNEQLQKIIPLPGNDGYAAFGVMDAGMNHPLYFVKTDTAGTTGCEQDISFTTTMLQANRNSFMTTYSGIGSTYCEALVSSILITALNVCGTASIEQENAAQEMNIFPNPAVNAVTMNGTKSTGEIIVYDVCGKELRKIKAFEGETRIDLEEFGPGIYFLHYSEAGKRNSVVSRKVIKF
jgi:hypothetical protein